MIRVVLFDLDGVLRHFDDEQISSIELEHGLKLGSVSRAAFQSQLLNSVTTGLMSRERWIEAVGAELGNVQAARDWGALRPVADGRMLELVDLLRGQGLIVAILTNGTNTIPEELEEQGIGIHFDRVFNSADIGAAKPDLRAFKHVIDELDVTASEIFFTDDSPGKLVGAQELGMPTHHFQNIKGLREALAEFDVLAQTPS